MKKTLAAVAVLGAFAGSALAADVTLYGRIDTGLVYQHTEVDGLQDVDKFSMESGWTTGSRWGIKGTEELGNGLKAGFVLEGGISSDDGKSAQGGRLFGRESVVYLSGDFGTVYAGRMASIASDSGSIGIIGAASAFGNCYGYASMKGATGSAFGRYDNLLAYVSPKFAGLQLSAQYSMGDGNGEENENNTNRYGVIGAKYAAGALTLVGTVEYYDYATNVDEGVAVMVGGNYNFGVATAYANVSYFDKVMDYLDSFSLMTGAVEGYGVEVGAKVPVAGGNVKANVSYRYVENVENADNDADRYAAAVAYEYPFSKRTHAYGALTWAQEETNEKTGDGFQFGFGLVHKF